MSDDISLAELEWRHRNAAAKMYDAEVEDFAKKCHKLFERLCLEGFTRKEALQIIIETIRIGKK
jgi:hypothetical protein